MTKRKNTFDSVFEIDETYESNSWIKVKIRTFAFGKNNNGSDILNSSFTDFEKARKSIGAVPIVAKYNDDSDDLEGHNVTMRENKEGELELYHDTDALGFTSPTANFYFEEVNEGTDEEPDYKTYVVVEDVYLWKRFDATKRIVKWIGEGIAPRVSMEIDQVEGQFDKEGYFQIHDFEFVGIAALGTDVEPCFPKAEIQLYTVNEFRQDLKKLMSELNYSIEQDSKGGNSVSEEKKDKLQEEAKVEDVKETEEKKDTAPEVAEPVSEPSKEDENKDIKEDVEQPQDDENKQDEAEQAIAKAELEYQKLLDSHKDLAYDFSLLEKEISDLKAYKRNREEQDVQAKFDGQLSKDEIEKVFADMKDKPVEEIEIKLFALVGQKSFSKKKKTVDADIVSAPVLANFQEEKKDSPYGNLFD